MSKYDEMARELVEAHSKYKHLCNGLLIASIAEAFEKQDKLINMYRAIHSKPMTEVEAEKIISEQRATIELLTAEREIAVDSVKESGVVNAHLRDEIKSLEAKLSLAVEALEKIADFEDDGIHPPREVCIARETLTQIKGDVA